MKSFLTNKFTIIGAIILAIALPVTIWQMQRMQDIRQRASIPQSILVNLTPSSSTINKNSTLMLDVIITTAHDVGSTEMTIEYDPTQLTFNSATPQAPLLMLDEKNTTNSKTITLYNPTSTQVIGQNIKIATFQFTPTAGNISSVTEVKVLPTIKFTATGVNGFIPSDQQSVLVGSYTIERGETIQDDPTIMPTEPTDEPGKTPTPTSVLNVTIPQSSPTSLPQSGDTILNLTFTLSGIGSSAIPSQQLNSSPVRPNRQGDLLVYDGNLNLVDAYQFSAVYDPLTSSYKTVANLKNLPSGGYLIKARLDNTLFKFIPGVQTISGGTANFYNTPLRLTSGDIARTVSSDNVIDIADYSALLACLSARVSNFQANAVGTPNCGIQVGVKADLNDDDTVDLKDLNILLRAFASRIGD